MNDLSSGKAKGEFKGPAMRAGSTSSYNPLQVANGFRQGQTNTSGGYYDQNGVFYAVNNFGGGALGSTGGPNPDGSWPMSSLGSSGSGKPFGGPGTGGPNGDGSWPPDAVAPAHGGYINDRGQFVAVNNFMGGGSGGDPCGFCDAVKKLKEMIDDVNDRIDDLEACCDFEEEEDDFELPKVSAAGPAGHCGCDGESSSSDSGPGPGPGGCECGPVNPRFDVSPNCIPAYPQGGAFLTEDGTWLYGATYSCGAPGDGWGYEIRCYGGEWQCRYGMNIYLNPWDTLTVTSCDPFEAEFEMTGPCCEGATQTVYVSEIEF